MKLKCGPLGRESLPTGADLSNHDVKKSRMKRREMREALNTAPRVVPSKMHEDRVDGKVSEGEDEE